MFHPSHYFSLPSSIVKLRMAFIVKDDPAESEVVSLDHLPLLELPRDALVELLIFRIRLVVGVRDVHPLELGLLVDESVDFLEDFLGALGPVYESEFLSDLFTNFDSQFLQLQMSDPVKEFLHIFIRDLLIES